MSEEDYYFDILSEEDEEEEDPYKKKEYQWGSQTPPPPPEPEPSPYQQDFYQDPYQAKPAQQEFYGDGYYQDYQSQREPSGPGKSQKYWFWVGVLIAAGCSVVIMLIFNFTGASRHPLVGYIEIILLLICCTLPGLFVRKVGKGILGGLMIFGMQFFIPLIVFYASGQNPAAFFSPYFIFLNALGLLKMGLNDVFGFTFLQIPPEIQAYYDQYAGYAAFVWVFDLLIMFGIMISVVIASSWLFSNLFTEKAKNFWTWFLLPGQAIVIIFNLVVIPYALLCMSSTVQIGGSLAAGGANIAEIAMPFIDGNTSLENLDTQAILARLDQADMWFELAKGNYEGLSNLQFFALLKAASMQYGFVIDIFDSTISAGFELLQALQPLGYGFFINSNDTDSEVDGLYYQLNEFMEVYDTFGSMFNSTGGKPTETQLAESEALVEGIITDIDYLLEYYFDEVFDHIIAAKDELMTINPDDLRNVGGNQQVQDVLNQVADQLDNIMNITEEYSILVPLILDLIDESPHLLRAMVKMLIGNVRLVLGYQFDQCRTYLTNASAELDIVMSIFTPARRTEYVNSPTALGFFDFANDTLNLLKPIIAEEGYLAGTIGNLVTSLDALVDPADPNSTDLMTVDYNQVFTNMSYAISNSTASVNEGTKARIMLDSMGDKINNSAYSIMNEPANTLVSAIDSAFQPRQFALVIDYMARGVNSTYASIYYIKEDDRINTLVELDNAEFELNNGIAVCDANPGTPVAAFKGFLEAYKNAVVDIRNTINAAADPINNSTTLNLIVNILATLSTTVHAIVDEGLPP